MFGMNVMAWNGGDLEKLEVLQNREGCLALGTPKWTAAEALRGDLGVCFLKECSVYLYKRRSDGFPVVIKQITLETLTSEEAKASLTEVQVLSILRHPLIVRYHDSFQHDLSIVIVMDYAAGGNLHTYLQSKLPSQFLQEQHAVELITQVVMGLQHIHHNKILHRDLKSQNIFLDGSHRYLKIGDFGISKILASKSKAHSVVGTPCYLSPELCQSKPYNQKSDVWALGCVLYELLSLNRAFQAETLPALFQKITRGQYAPVSSERYSEHLRSLLSSLLHLDPSARPTANQILAHVSIVPTAIRLCVDVGKMPLFGEVTGLSLLPS
ncbi:Protein kinase domain [Trinorchestia longiramus]|nr:Protein kinase domain [Trinorchestia longiramus]